MIDHYGSDFITIVDEDGEEYELEVLTSVEYNGQTYVDTVFFLLVSALALAVVETLQAPDQWIIREVSWGRKSRSFSTAAPLLAGCRTRNKEDSRCATRN